jgi:ribosomal protein S18 acetylase RimI-like enzyme
MDDADLAQRAIAAYGEALAALGRTGVGGAAELRRPDAVGARVPWAQDNHWLDAAIVPFGLAPPPDAADLPHCLWTAGAAPAGRSEADGAAMPCMALALDELASPPPAGPEPEAGATFDHPPLRVVGAVNDHAYGQPDRMGRLLAAVDEPRFVTYGLRVHQTWACVAAILRLDDHASVQYVATDHAFRRRGLAASVVRRALAEARADGARIATLEASAEGFGLYERLGFKTVATLRAFVRA